MKTWHYEYTKYSHTLPLPYAYKVVSSCIAAATTAAMHTHENCGTNKSETNEIEERKEMHMNFFFIENENECSMGKARQKRKSKRMSNIQCAYIYIRISGVSLHNNKIIVMGG